MVQYNELESGLLIRVFTIFVLYTFFCVPAFADEKDPNPFNLPDTVMALPKELKGGQPFMGYPKLSPQVSWHAIPPWLTGTWKSKEQRITRDMDYETGAWFTIPKVEAAISIESFGDLLDQERSYWHAIISPDINDFQIRQFVDTRNTISAKMLESSADRVRIWSRVFHIIYNPVGRQIVNSYTEEKVIEFQPTGRGRMEAQSYIRLYDSNGYLQKMAYTLRDYVRQVKFQPRRHRADIDLCGSLSSHLQYIGRHDLINW